MKTNLTLFAALAFFGLGYAQNHTPVAVTGFNFDVIAESSPAMSSTNSAIDGSNYVFYSAAYGTTYGTGLGLPNSGLVATSVGNYQFQPYSGNNVLLLMQNGVDSLEFTTPTSYSSLSVMGCSTEGAGSVSMVIKFTDGTSISVPSTNLPDWFNGASAVIGGFDRTGRTNDSPNYNSSAPYLYRINQNFSCADQSKMVQRILFTNTSTAATVRTCIFAVSGTKVVGATIFNQQNVSCFGENNGLIQLSATGLNPVTFAWNTMPVQTTYQATNIGPGTYACTITDATGCTSQISATITEPSNIASSQSATICGGETFVVGPYSHTTSGTYQDVLTAANGCDSTVTTTLVVNTVNPAMGITGTGLTAVTTGASYQWLNCSFNFSEVPGETGQNFAPTDNGYYAVEVSLNGCSDTSQCVIFNSAGVEEQTTVAFELYPNPTSSVLTIVVNEAILTSRIVDLSGKTIRTNTTTNEINVADLETGSYILYFETSNGNRGIRKFVKID